MVAIAQELDLPVRYVGTGEGLDDFSIFDPRAFAEGLFAESDAVGDGDAA